MENVRWGIHPNSSKRILTSSGVKVGDETASLTLKGDKSVLFASLSVAALMTLIGPMSTTDWTLKPLKDLLLQITLDHPQPIQVPHE